MQNKMSLFLIKIKGRFSFLKNVNSLFYYFLLLLVVGFIFFATSLLTESFSTSFTGDYTTQGIAFYLDLYDDWWHFVRTGSFRYYDTNTFLGANNIGSNSFYSVLDPFFFIVMIFPRKFMIQAMAFSTIFRMSLSGLVFYFYLRYMGVSDRSGRLAGVAYAYCGWTAWYLWFSNFTENALTFVLILWGIEKVLREKKPWLLMFALFVSGLTNYFFLICFTMMGFIYAMWRYFQRLKLNSAKDNLVILGVGFVGFLVGLMLACVVVLPSVYIAMSAPRVTSADYLESLKTFIKNHDFKNLFNYLFSWKNVDSKLEYRQYFPIIDFFYPAMSNRGTPLTRYGNETYDNVAGSIFSYYPFLILLIPALIRSCKKKDFWPLAAFVFFAVSLYTPFFYYLFFGFTKPYSRWTIFVTTSLLTYVAIYFDHVKEEPVWTILLGGLFTLLGMVVASGLASHIVNTVSAMSMRNDIGLVTTLACVYVVVLTIGMFFLLNKKWFSQLMFAVIAVEAGIMGALVIDGHGVTTYEEINYGDKKNEALAVLSKQINASDPSYFRAISTLAADGAKNDGMRNDYNGASFFHSLYNFNVVDFVYDQMIMTSRTGWSGRYIEKRIGLDKFLGVKYYYIEKDRTRVKVSLDENNKAVYEYIPNVPLGFEDISGQHPNGYFYTYEDKSQINFAFSYDTLYVRNPENGSTPMCSDFASSYSDNAYLAVRNEEIYLKGAVLTREDIAEIKETAGDDLTVEDIYTVNNMETKPVYRSSSYTANDISRKVYTAPSAARDLSIKQLLDIVDTTTGSTSMPGKNDKLQYFFVYEPKAGKAYPYDPEGMIYYINSSYQSNRKVNIYFIGEDGKVLTWDNHNDDRSTDASLRRGPRGFYIRKDGDNPAPKLSKIIIVPRWSDINTRDDIYYDSYTAFKARNQKFSDNPVTDIVYKDNHFSFKTNFTKTRFVTTQIAYEKGWSVTAKDSSGKTASLKPYLSQGGFVSFIAPAGEMSYEMDFYPPYLKMGTYISLVGLICFSTSLLAYLYIDTELNKKKLFKLL